MGYRPVSAWDAFNSYVPATLARPLRTGAPVTLHFLDYSDSILEKYLFIRLNMFLIVPFLGRFGAQ